MDHSQNIVTSDKQITAATNSDASNSAEKEVGKKRLLLGATPAHKPVNTCDAQCDTNTPYGYSCYDYKWESFPSKSKKIRVKFDIWKWPKRNKTSH